jgi:hypothetical protein
MLGVMDRNIGWLRMLRTRFLGRLPVMVLHVHAAVVGDILGHLG